MGGAFAAGAAPEKVFAPCAPRRCADAAGRWGLETTSRARVHAGALRAWRKATRIVARGARDAKDATLPTVAREAARCRASLAARCAKDGGEADAAREAAAFARGVAGFAARLAATPGAAEALFGEEAEEASEEASSEEASSDGADSSTGCSTSPTRRRSLRGAPSATTKKEKKKKKETTTTTTTKNENVAAPDAHLAARGAVRGGRPVRVVPRLRRRAGEFVRGAGTVRGGPRAGQAPAGVEVAALRRLGILLLERRRRRRRRARTRPPRARRGASPAAALDEAVSAARESLDLHAALGDAFWSRRVEVAAECAEAFVDAAWGAGLEATRPEGAPDPAAMSDKQRQLVKDRFAAVNAAADA